MERRGSRKPSTAAGSAAGKKKIAAGAAPKKEEVAVADAKNSAAAKKPQQRQRKRKEPEEEDVDVVVDDDQAAKPVVKRGKAAKAAKPAAEPAKGKGKAKAKAGANDCPADAVSVSADGLRRCWESYSGNTSTSSTLRSPKMLHYHDSIWGFPEDDPNKLFTQLCLQLMQCGLTWSMILNKEDGIKAAFHNFDLQRVSAMTEKDIDRLMQNTDVVRNRRKLESIVNNAKCAHKLEKEGPGFVKFVWSHAPTHVRERHVAKERQLSSYMRTDFKTPATERFDSDGVHPTVTVARFTAALKAAGFKHLGETTVLSFMQASGMVNHHKQECFAFAAAEQKFAAFAKKFAHLLPK
eukprot:m.66748 g.66748  ORF g.66748 m.66748 type:complete len:351 (+) comp14065_c0_seq2:67-1119(+)